MLTRMWGYIHYWCFANKQMLPLWQSVWKILKTLKVDLPYDPAISLLGISPKDSTSCFMNTLSAMVFAALFLTAKNWKQPRCPTDGQGEASASDWTPRHLYLNHAHLHVCTRPLLIKQQNALFLSFACCCCSGGPTLSSLELLRCLVSVAT